MKRFFTSGLYVGCVWRFAAELKVDLGKGKVGKAPEIFEPIVGTWVVAQDGGDKVIMVDGRPWVASKDNPTKLLVQTRAEALRHVERRADG